MMSTGLEPCAAIWPCKWQNPWFSESSRLCDVHSKDLDRAFRRTAVGAWTGSSVCNLLSIILNPPPLGLYRGYRGYIGVIMENRMEYYPPPSPSHIKYSHDVVHHSLLGVCNFCGGFGGGGG